MEEFQINGDQSVVQDQNKATVKQTSADIIKSKGNVFFGKIMLWMGLGLLVTFLFGYLYPYIILNTVSFDIAVNVIFITCFVSSIAAFIEVFILMFTVFKKGGISLVPYLIYSVLIGLALSPILIFNDAQAVLITIGITAGMFILLGIVGILFKGRIGFIIGGVGVLSIGALCLALTNLFLGSEMIFWIVSFLLLIITMAYVVIDVNLIKHTAQYTNQTRNEALYLALVLYTDFIRLFIYLLPIVLRILANSRR